MPSPLLTKFRQCHIRTRNFYDARIAAIAGFAFILSGIASIAILILEFGFYYPEDWSPVIRRTATLIVLYLIFYEILAFIFTHENHRVYLKGHKFEIAIVVAIIIQWLLREDIMRYFLIEGMTVDQAAILYLALNQIFLFLSNITRIIRRTHLSKMVTISPSMIFIISFLLVITVGWMLLMMPRSHRVPIRAIDALFTVVSAVSVTGLSSISVPETLTRTGQVVLLIVIQIGGLGLMTLTSFFALSLTGKSSVSNQLIMKDLLSEESMGSVRHLIRSIAMITIWIEGMGALLLFLTDPQVYPSYADRFFYSIFHSISAFCNAGFSIYPQGLVGINSAAYLFVIMGLIVFGGFGFPILREIRQKLRALLDPGTRFSVSVKINLTMHAILISSGTLFYLLIESNYTLKDLSEAQAGLHSLFYSVTLRTAGFNTLPIEQMSVAMLTLSLFFMWIGASPASTGGGIKTSTFAIVFLHMINFARGRERLEIFHRTIAPISISRAFSTVLLSLTAIFATVFLLTLTESFRFEDLLYECVSAFGTVGLSRGITSGLSDPGKLAICLLMLTGRIGLLTFVIALIPKSPTLSYRYPDEYVIVG
jgi:potassium uptake TrkH family protein